MKNIVALIVSLFLTISSMAQTVPVPPNKVPQADGTIQLVPVPPGFVYTPYFIDPTIQYQLYLTSDWSNKRWDGGNKLGTTAFKNNIIDAKILAMPILKTKIVDGKTITMWSIYRSADVVIQYDHTRLELLPYNPTANGFGYDPNVMDPTKTKYTILGDGLVLFHSEALPAPENRNPKKPPQYYQWNFDGYMWQGAYRVLGRIQFKVKDDYYLPSFGSQKAFIRVLPLTTFNGETIKTKIDGSPTIGTNVLSQIRSEGEDIQFGAPPTHKVSHYLVAETIQYKVGDIVPVQVKIKPETAPQFISWVATNFVWDNTKLEFMGINKTGARASQSSKIDLPGVGAINETAIPKDGNAWHNWLSVLGDKSYLTGEALIVTLNFKVIADFNKTNVEIVKKADPRIAGLWVPEESSVGGSNLPGSVVLGTQTPSVTINGIAP